MRLIILAILALAWGSAAEAKWREASTRHFVIYSEQSERDLREFADQLERLDRALRVQLRRPDPERSPSSRLTIYVLPNQARLQDFLGFSGVAGIYMPRASGSVSFTHRDRERPRGRSQQQRGLDPRVVLFHEYTHHFLFNNFDFGAPLWFSEGFAEFWSTTDFARDGAVHYGLPGTHRTIELSELPPIPVSRLINMRFPIRDQMAYATIYGRGWVLSHYLMFEPTRAGQLDAYLAALAAGRSSEEAAAAFGDLGQLDRELSQYMNRGRFLYGVLPADQIPEIQVSIRELGPGEEAMMSVHMRSRRGVTERQARALVPEARRVAERFPNDPAVQEALAEAELDAKNFAEAEAAADRAIAADPRRVQSHLYKARAIWGRLEAAENKDPAEWAAVRRIIGTANQLDPDDPEPLVTFFESFEASGQEPTANAIDGLLFARSIAREDRSLRVAAARQLLIRRDAASARAMLAPLVGDSHSGRLGEKVGEVLAVLDGGDPAAALATLDAFLEEQKRRAESGS